MYVQGLLLRWNVLCLFELLRRSGHCFANASDLHRWSATKIGKSEVAKLKPYKNDLEHLLSMMTVQGRKEPNYQPVTQELEVQSKAFTDFVWNCTLELAEVDALEKDDPHDEKFQGIAGKLKTFCTNAEHHYNGAKGAKARYSGILGVK